MKLYELKPETPIFSPNRIKEGNIKRGSLYGLDQASNVWLLYNHINRSIRRAFHTKNLQEYVKLDERVQNQLVTFFGVN